MIWFIFPPWKGERKGATSVTINPRNDVLSSTSAFFSVINDTRKLLLIHNFFRHARQGHYHFEPLEKKFIRRRVARMMRY